MGHGGSFIYNAFLKENPENIIFHKYISINPTSCNIPIIEERLDNLNFEDNTDFKIYFAQSDTPVEPIYDLFKERNFPFLELLFSKYENDDHSEVVKQAMKEGLEFVYDK